MIIDCILRDIKAGGKEMPRVAREKCGNSIYHICVRGNNKQDIFLDNEDREEYLKRVRNYEERYKMQIYAYCLMTNHVHLLIYDNDQDISKFMQGLSLSYVIYFNKKYGRTGHLFQDRFTSVMIKNDMQLMYVSRYIHLNPVRAKMVNRAKDYKWSSYSSYETGKDRRNIVSCAFLLGYFSTNEAEARFLYRKYINGNVNDEIEEEIATTEEDGVLINKKRVGLARVTQKDIYEGLSRVWHVNIQKLMSKGKNQDNRKRMIVIFLVGLLGRKAYSDVAKLIHVGIGEVYKSVREIVKLMIANNHFKNEVDRLIALEWNKNKVLSE